jgi:putative Mn2+ efflux pump MntP
MARKARGESSTTIVLIALALSIDAFAVSVAAAAAGGALGKRAVFRLSFHFGLFQAMMPVLGWAAGMTLAPIIAPVDHWVAFALLVTVAVRMLRAAREPEAAMADDPSRGLTLLMLAVATSIDALAVGLSLAMVQVAIWTPALTIGIITAAMSLLGIWLGGRLKVHLGTAAQVLGAVILVVIAVRIVGEHVLGW